MLFRPELPRLSELYKLNLANQVVSYGVARPTTNGDVTLRQDVEIWQSGFETTEHSLAVLLQGYHLADGQSSRSAHKCR